MEIELFIPRTSEAVVASLSLIDGASLVSCDIETTGFRSYSDKMLSIGVAALYNDGTAFVVIVPFELLPQPEVKDAVWDAIYRRSRRMVGANLKFDLSFISRWVNEMPPDEALLGDTLLLSHLLDERPNRPTSRVRGLGLKEQAETRYDVPDYGWSWDSFYACMAADQEAWAAIEMSEIDMTVTTDVTCDDCARVLSFGDRVVAYTYADLPGPEWVCWDCKDKHDRLDRWPTTDWDGLYKYQAMDCAFTARLWFDLVDEAAAESPRLLEFHDAVTMPAARALSAAEMAGAPMDEAWLLEFAAWLHRRIDRRRAVLDATLSALRPAYNAVCADTDCGHLLLQHRDDGCWFDDPIPREDGVDEEDVPAKCACAGYTDPPLINITAPLQVANVMYDPASLGGWHMTPDARRSKSFKEKVAAGGSGGASILEDRSTDREHLEAAVIKYGTRGTKLFRQAQWLRSLLRLRADVKNLSTYSESLLKMMDDDGRIRGGFLLHGTSTGRLSSTKPNLQNIPAVGRHGETPYPPRRGFAARPGYVMCEADYKTLELRVAAWLSGDDAMRAAFVAGKDIHLDVAAAMFSKPPETVSKGERYLAKAVDFGILFGRTAKALVSGAEMDFYVRKMGGHRWVEEEAELFIQKFLGDFPQLRNWIEEQGQRGIDEHYVESPFGRRRRFPLRPRSKWDILEIKRQAVNTPVQGSASDLCIMALTRITRRLAGTDLDATVLFPVHDSILLEILKSDVDAVVTILREEMEIVLPGGVPLAIDVEVGPNWADVKELHHAA